MKSFFTNNLIDRFLNGITMYRLVLWYAAALLAAAFGLGFFGLVPAEPTKLAFSLVVILGTSLATNRLFGWLMRVPVNAESVYITVAILALVMPPVAASNHAGVLGLVVASVVAIASKFLLAVRRQHIFNPVAIGIFVSALAVDQPATWWVGGNLPLLPLVLLGGLLVVRKVQRFDLVGIYILASLVATLAFVAPADWSTAIGESILHSPLLFAGFAMLTEPLTAPSGRLERLVFGVIVGALSSPDVHIGDYYATPEFAFLVGNLFAFAVGSRRRFKFVLQRIEKTAEGCYDYVFKTRGSVRYRAGQYIDWTLDVPRADNRGNRRPFTIASGPNEAEVRLGVKFYPKPSAFKRRLAAMKPGDVIYGSQVAGSFTLPRDAGAKLAFIAGGIGITPFRSMISEMVERGDNRSAVLLYGNNRPEEIAYSDVFEWAGTEIGLRTVYAVAEGGGDGFHKGFIDEALIRREVPDFRDRVFYISGPRAMVLRFKRVLADLGVARSRIKVDFFPGFA